MNFRLLARWIEAEERFARGQYLSAAVGFAHVALDLACGPREIRLVLLPTSDVRRPHACVMKGSGNLNAD